MITITLQRSIKKPVRNNFNGEVMYTLRVFVYLINGDVEEMNEYKTKMGDHYRENDHGDPLYFSIKYYENKGNWNDPIHINPWEIKYPKKRKRGK